MSPREREAHRTHRLLRAWQVFTEQQAQFNALSDWTESTPFPETKEGIPKYAADYDAMLKKALPAQESRALSLARGCACEPLPPRPRPASRLRRRTWRTR